MVQDVEKRNKKAITSMLKMSRKRRGCVYNCFKAFITGGNYMYNRPAYYEFYEDDRNDSR